MYADQKIPEYSIFIQSGDMDTLRRDIWSDDPVDAKFKAGGKQYSIGLAYRGSLIRNSDKKSYHCLFVKPNRFRGAKEIHLNAEFMDPSLIRNKLSLDFFSRIGTLSPRSKHVLLMMNGEFQGVYLQLESVDELFLKNRGLPNGAIYYAEDDNANFSLISPLDEDIKSSFDSGYSRKYGSEQYDKILQKFIYKINTTPKDEFERTIKKYVNIKKYLRWLAGVVCTQNFDGFIHNYALYYNSSTQLFEPIPWDYDATWGIDIHGHKLEYDSIPIEGYNTLSARILDTKVFRAQYKQIMEEILDNHLTVSALGPKIKTLHRMIRKYLLKDPYKKEQVEQFDQEPDIIIEYIQKRNHYLRQHLTDLD